MFERFLDAVYIVSRSWAFKLAFIAVNVYEAYQALPDAVVPSHPFRTAVISAYQQGAISTATLVIWAGLSWGFLELVIWISDRIAARCSPRRAPLAAVPTAPAGRAGTRRVP